MSEKAEGRERAQEQKQQENPPPSDEKKRKPRGALLRGDDPTLAKRVEEELYSFGR